MESIIHNIIKQQNYDIICRIADKTEISKEYLLKKYWTPSFYLVGKDLRNIYDIQEKPKPQSKIKNNANVEKDG